MTIKLDTTGLLCPMPIIEVAKKMRKLKKGSILEVWSDDPVIQVDLPAWCQSTGNQFIDKKKAGSTIVLHIKKETK